MYTILDEQINIMNLRLHFAVMKLKRNINSCKDMYILIYFYYCNLHLKLKFMLTHAKDKDIKLNII